MDGKLLERAICMGIGHDPGPSSPFPSQPVQGQIQRFAEVALGKIIQNPALEVAEYLKRVEPNDGWYDPIRSPNSPTQFEIMNFTVPKGKAIIILEFNFEPFVFSGVSGTAIPAEEGDLNGIIGYNFRINETTPAVTDFVLEPTPSNYQREQFRPPKTQLVPPQQKVVADFQRTAATAYGAASGFGTAILPQRRGAIGSTLAPRAFIAREDEHVVMTGIIYRQMPIPIAFVEASFRGYSVPTKLLGKLLVDLQAAQ